jgi:cysteine/O-acetylserine efflux protein
MRMDMVPLASFVLITTFTPGPNNISSASMGILNGYKNTLGYMFGITAGFFVIMLLCALISTTLLQILPTFENVLRLVGAVYILWPAYHTLKASYTFQDEQQVSFGFSKGFFLQLLNPKVIVYGLTLYSAFLGRMLGSPVYLVISAVVLAGVGFCAVST